MGIMKNKIKMFFKENKGFTLSILFIVLLLCYVAIPTLSEENNTIPMYSITAWDGTVAESYSAGDGSKDNPYVISNGNELAYFALQLKNDSYLDKCFILKNDIVLNDGTFSYTKEDGIKYIKDNDENIIVPGIDNEIINVFEHLNNFKGNFDGDFHTIYGLYIDKNIDEQNGLFTNLSGNVSNLYIKNSMIYGGRIVGGVVSKANNSLLTNISYNGYVISDDAINDTVKLELNDMNKKNINSELVEKVNITGGYVPGVVSSISLGGIYQTDNANAVLKINGLVVTANNDGKFELDLGNKLDGVTVEYQTDIESNFSLSDLYYEVNYSYGNAAGIISISENTKLKNIINKASVYASVLGSGIVNNVYGEFELKNSYNVGVIDGSNVSSGLISNINFNDKDVSIINSYNDGILNSDNDSMIGNIESNTGNVNLINVFNTQDVYVINRVSSSLVNIDNSYVISDKFVKDGLIQDVFELTSLSNLKNKNFVKTNLKFLEYEELENDNVWVWSFDEDVLPMLYIDELNKPIANIYIKEYIWNDYKKNLETLNFSDKLVFNISEYNALNPIKEVYYYVSNEKNVLTKTQLDSIDDWNKYEKIVELTEEGFYVVYAKVIDNDGNVIYLNTDLLVIDFTGADVSITTSFNDNVWNEFRTNLNNYYINEQISLDVKSDDLVSGINGVYYYLSAVVVSRDDIEKIEEWNEYVEPILITDAKTILYVKVIDNSDNVTYVNSDLIIMNGYVLKSVSAGMNGSASNNLYITGKSSVSLNYVYSDTNEYVVGGKHQLISNVLLPVNTKITLIDKIKNKVYVYVTTNDDYGYNACTDTECIAIYNFELFNEVGSNNKFNENNYSGEINEDFIVLVDFYNAKIDKNIEDIVLSLRIDNSNANEIRNTLIDDKKFSVIYDNSQGIFTLSSLFEDTIIYNENGVYTVEFTTKLDYITILDNKVYDTTLEDKNIGLSIKMVNSEGNVVSKQDLKNIVFKYGNKKYSPDSDGIVNINLEKGINDITDSLVIETYSDNYNLDNGNYKFIISLYTSYDGIYSEDDLSSIEIPVYVGDNIYKNDTSFNVVMSNDDKIVTSKENEFNFEFLVSKVTEGMDIRMSLYKKDSIFPDNQKYSIVDLGEYVINNNFELRDTNVYYALKNVDEYNKLNINLNTGLLKKNGYMFVFELYEDGRLVNRINKKFIVK